MIKGIIFFEQGGLQPIGELNSLAGILATIKQVLPELEQKEAARLMDNLTDEELERVIEARKQKKETTSKLSE